MKDNYSFSVGCVVVRGDEVLLVRHTYGGANRKLLIPGGYLNDGELPKEAAKKVYAPVEKYSNPYLKEDFDYYVESGFYKKRAVFACLWKDRGLYTGTSAQFCALYIK